MLTPRRRYDAELMDRDDNPRDVLELALADLDRVNRWLGGRTNLLSELDPWLAPREDGRPLRVLDVGTGGADLPRALVERARARDLAIEVVGVDRDPHTAAIAEEAVRDDREIEIVRADAFALPFEARSFDLVITSLFLHHFVEDDIVRLLREFARVGERAIVINDLHRNWIPWGFIWLVGHVTLRQKMFRHDAPLSVLRGFTADELTELGRRAGATQPDVAWRWPFRLALTIPVAELGA